MRRLLPLLALLTLPVLAHAQPALDWAYTHRPDVIEGSSVADLVVDAEGHTYVAGTYIDSAGGASTLDDVIVLKLSPEGTVLWEDIVVLSSSWDEGYTLALDGQGHLYVAANRAEDYLHVRKYTTAGALVWERTFTERLASPDPCYLALAPDGALVLAVPTSTPSSGFSDDIWVLKVSPEGATLWEHLYQGIGGNFVQTPRGVAVHTDGTIAVVGRTAVNDQGPHALVYALSPGGAFLWQRTVDGTDVGSNWFGDVAFGPDGSLYVTGHILNTGAGGDVLTEKLAPGGAVVWSTRFNNPETSDNDYGYDLALAADGAVYVTGETSFGVFTDRYFDVLTIGYRPDGTVAWWDPIDSGDPSRDSGTEIALDGAGRVVVQGMVKANPGNNFVSITALYTPDGERVWADIGDLDADETAGFDLDVTGDWITIGGFADTGPGFEHLFVARYESSAAPTPTEPVLPGAAFALSAPVPNPARAAARLNLSLPHAQRVTVAVFDALGRRVTALHDGSLAAGVHALTLDAARLTPGVYVVRATSGDGSRVARRLVVAR